VKDLSSIDVAGSPFRKSSSSGSEDDVGELEIVGGLVRCEISAKHFDSKGSAGGVAGGVGMRSDVNLHIGQDTGAGTAL
jgi:hypothetical protein